MKTALRSLMFGLGIKTPKSILSPIATIVADLEAFAAHQTAQIKAVGVQQQAHVRRGQALTERKRVLAAAAEEARAAAARVNTLIA